MLQRVLLLLSAAALPGAAIATPWTLTKGISLRGVFSDNIDLSPSGQESADFITDITPFFSIRRKEGATGGRVNLNLDYNFQTLNYRYLVPTSFQHQLQLLADAELVKEALFLDLRSTIGQQPITNRRPSSGSTLSSNSNLTNVYTFLGSPSWKTHLENYADTELRYTYSSVINGSAGATDSDAHKFGFIISSGTKFSRLPWRITYQDEVVDFEDGTDSNFRRLLGTLRYPFTPQLSALLEGGIEQNDFSSTQEKQDGPYWRVGGIWTPNLRTSLTAGFGERFFGSNYFLDISHRRHRTIWKVQYNEDLTTVRQTQLERVLVPLVDPFGNPITIDFGEGPVEILVPLDTPTLTTESYVRRRLEGSMAARGRRQGLDITLYGEQREFQVSGEEEKLLGVEARTDRRLTRNTTTNLRVRWQKSEFLGGAQDSDRREIGLNISRRLRQNVNGRLEYVFTDQDSNEELDQFQENRFGFQFSMGF